MIKKYKDIRHNMTFIRYALGGAIAAGIDLVFLRIFTDFAGIYYLWSQILAFIISFSFGFIFQKYVAFRDHSNHKTIKQGLLFLLFQLLGLGGGLLILKLSVEYLHLYYIRGSVIAKGVIFIWNYLMNLYFNFGGKKGK